MKNVEKARGKKMVYEQIGKLIREKRKEQNLTQEQLAEKTGLSVTHISNIENNHTKLSIEKLIIIAKTLNLSLDSLIFDEIKETKQNYIINIPKDNIKKEDFDFLRKVVLYGISFLNK